MNSASLRRLASDHAALHKLVLPPYYLHPTGSSMPDDLTQLTILLAGPSGTPYENGLWKLHLRIPIDYPKSPPKASFRTKIFHPNVEEATGAVCLDTLKRDWSPQLTLRDILITISCLLINPNPDSALNSSAGKLLQEDFDAFAKKARLMTSIHAVVPRDLRLAVEEAVTRGEEKAEDSDSVYGEDQENDPSISPSPVSPRKPIERHSILGKRPLADLPTPTEDSFEQKRITINEMNIMANTPNLSSEMSSLSFTGTTPSLSQPQQQRRIAHPHAHNAPSTTQLTPRTFTFTGLSTSFNTPSDPHPQPQSAKRPRTFEGKENEDLDLREEVPVKQIKIAMDSTATRPHSFGLGVKLNPAPRTTLAAKSRVRMGIRRL